VANDRYVIEGQLGRGHFGVVYLARHVALDRTCALKVIAVRTTSAEVLEEARKLAALPAHDNVVEVFDAGAWDDDHVFIASELCTGGSLADRAGGDAFDPATACGAISEACRGLDHLHQHQLLHLDIRPANILVSNGAPRLVDFGLARWMRDADVEDWYGPHAAPELVETGRAAPSSDIYAMAMTLAHLLTGGSICRPFPVNVDLVRASADGDWPRLAELPPNVPPRLRRLLDLATRYDVEERPPSVREFKRLLDKATPAVSFLAAKDGCTLISSDGVWSISTTSKSGRFGVDVRRNGRRQSALGVANKTAAEARKHVDKLVKKFADAAP
jgi:eukaryotic-like serine/threonine-protein kinase